MRYLALTLLGLCLHATPALAEEPPSTTYPGFTRSFTDGFTSPLGEEWNRYWGQPGSDPGGWWAPDHSEVYEGGLHLESYIDPLTCGCSSLEGRVSGGVELKVPQTYGKYLVRMQAEDGQGVTLVALLWPANNTWPPEVDFAEDNGANPRSTIYGTLHHGAADEQQEASVQVNAAQWNTFGVEWTKEKLAYTLNGKTWATMTQGVPSIPMVLDIQQQTWNCGGWETCPNSSTPADVRLNVDWVEVFKAEEARQEAKQTGRHRR